VLNVIAEELVKMLAASGATIAAAESCTAGLAAASIAEIPGASHVLWGSFVVYTVDAKVSMLGIPLDVIETYGAVSKPVATAMAEAALEKSGALWAFSVTGFAGPGAGIHRGEEIPAGTVWIAVAGRDGANTGLVAPGGVFTEARAFAFPGSRNEVRRAAAAAALREVLQRASAQEGEKN